MLEQRGDHTCSEWNDQGCLFGGRRGMNVAEILLLVSDATTAMRMAAATRPLTLNNDAGQH